MCCYGFGVVILLGIVGLGVGFVAVVLLRFAGSWLFGIVVFLIYVVDLVCRWVLLHSEFWCFRVVLVSWGCYNIVSCWFWVVL